MIKKLALLIAVVLAAALLVAACDITDASLGLAAPEPAPASTFVTARARLQVGVGETVLIETYHLSQNSPAAMKVWVNGQPVGADESTPAAAVFPDSLATVELATVRPVPAVFNCAAVVCLSTADNEPVMVKAIIQRGPLRSAVLRPEFPNSTWAAPLLWTGHVPGTFDLSVQVTDRAGKTGPKITQRIEVQ